MGREVVELQHIDTKDKSVPEVHISIAEALERFAESRFAPSYYTSDMAHGWSTGYSAALEDFKELLRTGKLTRESV